MTLAPLSTEPSADVVASVAGWPVSRAELADFTERLRSGAYASVLPTAGIDGRRFDRWALQLLIREALVLHRADQLPMSGRREGAPRDVLRAAVRQVKEDVTAGVAVREEAVRGYYERNVERFVIPERRRVRHVLCDDRSTADSVLRELLRGTAFAEVASRRSTDAASAARGGDIGLVRSGELPRELDTAVFAAPPYAVSGPVRSGLGWHVFRVDDVTAAGRLPYEQVREEIEADLLAQAREAAFRGWLDLAAREQVTLSRGFEHPGDPSAAEPYHRH